MFERKKHTPPQKRIDSLIGAGTTVHGDVHFKGGSLRGARFRGANLRYAVFIECDLEGADFTGADLTDATFVSNHEKANFQQATLDRVAWNEADDAQRRARFPDRHYMLLGPHLK